jgi:hypothetical protein
MTDEECRQLYERLTQLLQRLELNWVAELSRQETGIGKLVKQQEEYGLISYREPGSRSRRRGPKSLMTVEYTEPERLRLLLTFIKQAVVDTTLLESRLVNYFGDGNLFNQETSIVRFIDGEDDPSPHILSRDNFEARETHAHRLKELIAEILNEVDNGSQR